MGVPTLRGVRLGGGEDAMATSEQTGVDLAGGRSATHHLHQVLAGTQERFADAFGDVGLGATSDEFKHRYPEALPRFEAARVA